MPYTKQEKQKLEQTRWNVLRSCVCWQPYFEQLPEYEYLRKELTAEWS